MAASGGGYSNTQERGVWSIALFYIVKLLQPSCFQIFYIDIVWNCLLIICCMWSTV